MKTRTRMRHIALALLTATFAALAPVLAQAQTDPLSGQSAASVMPDPVPGQGADFKPSAATATEAYMGMPRLERDTSCTEFNPCALPSSAPHPLGQLSDLSR